MAPPRGPRRVLWVVVVTMWAYFTGLSSRPAAIRPAGWAMSLTGVSGSTSDNQLGPVLEGCLLHLVVVHAAGLLVELVSYGMIVDTGHVDGRAVGKVSAVCQAGEPWVRCPPCARSRPMKVSPGLRHAMNTAILACAPE